MNAVRDLRGDRLPIGTNVCGVAIASLALAAPVVAAERSRAPQWNLPEAREVAFGGQLGGAYE